MHALSVNGRIVERAQHLCEAPQITNEGDHLPAPQITNEGIVCRFFLQGEDDWM